MKRAVKTCDNELFLRECDCKIVAIYSVAQCEKERFSDQVRMRLLDVLDAVDTFDEWRAAEVRRKVWRLHQLLVRGDINPLHWTTCNELLFQLAAWIVFGRKYGQNYPDGLVKGLCYMLRESETALATIPPHHQEAAHLCVEVGKVLLEELNDSVAGDR